VCACVRCHSEFPVMHIVNVYTLICVRERESKCVCVSGVTVISQVHINVYMYILIYIVRVRWEET